MLPHHIPGSAGIQTMMTTKTPGILGRIDLHDAEDLGIGKNEAIKKASKALKGEPLKAEKRKI